MHALTPPHKMLARVARLRLATSTAVGVRPNSSLAGAFDPAAVEKGRYEVWDTARRAHAAEMARGAVAGRPVFSMLLPPPNVTGALHIGHALTATVQDALARWRRMSGDEVVWVPGLDHAGIATQSVVEKKLLAERQVTRHDLGRDKFLEQVWAWKAEYGGRINEQLRSMGALLDWEREYFTMDAARSAAVNEAFERLFRSDRIVRGARMINWCPRLQTAISDIEVEVKQIAPASKLQFAWRADPVEVGLLDHFAYPIIHDENQVNSSSHDGVSAEQHQHHKKEEEEQEVIVVATTRLETMLGDTAVAVHPEDDRYRSLIGKFVRHPLTGRRLPIIADAILVDPKAGTGAVKITPAHDPNDLECARRHSLEHLSILDETGRVHLPESLRVGRAAAFHGLDRFDARVALRRTLTELGVFRSSEPHAMALAVCSRTGDVLEPTVRAQWWVRTQDMAQRSLAMVRSGAMTLTPRSAEEQWAHWLESNRDWCISRQLWWGHRIPIWRVHRDSPLTASSIVGHDLSGSHVRVFANDGSGPVDAVVEEWVVATDAQTAQRRAEAVSLPGHVVRVEQDEDVLDTWFSSGLLPLSAFGWPTADSTPWQAGSLRRHQPLFPLTVMETGTDILFFWVARMAMLCSEMVGGPEPTPPFRRVLLHPLVRDRQGRKMSKSLGNVIDPLAVIQGRSLADLLADLERGNLPASERTVAAKGLRQDMPQGIPACGTDALRAALANYMQANGKIHLDVQRIHGFRLFANKMWNAAKFVAAMPGAPIDHHGVRARPSGLGAAGGVSLPSDESAPLVTRWALSRLARATREVEEGMQTFDLGAATASAQRFVHAEFCDVLIEWSKVVRREDARVAADVYGTLAVCLDGALRLWHPFMPFITEHLWEHLQTQGLVQTSGPLLLASFPGSAQDLEQSKQGAGGSPSVLAYESRHVDEAMQVLIDVVSAGRALQATLRRLGASPSGVIQAHVTGPDRSAAGGAATPLASSLAGLLLTSHAHELRALLRAEVKVVTDHPTAGVAASPQSQSGHLVQAAGVHVTLSMALPREVVGAARSEAERLQRRADKLEAKAADARKRLADPAFSGSAPEHIRDETAASALEAERAAAADRAAAAALESAAR